MKRGISFQMCTYPIIYHRSLGEGIRGLDRGAGSQEEVGKRQLEKKQLVWSKRIMGRIKLTRTTTGGSKAGRGATEASWKINVSFGCVQLRLNFKIRTYGDHRGDHHGQGNREEEHQGSHQGGQEGNHQTQLAGEDRQRRERDHQAQQAGHDQRAC